MGGLWGHPLALYCLCVPRAGRCLRDRQVLLRYPRVRERSKVLSGQLGECGATPRHFPQHGSLLLQHGCVPVYNLQAHGLASIDGGCHRVRLEATLWMHMACLVMLLG